MSTSNVERFRVRRVRAYVVGPAPAKAAGGGGDGADGGTAGDGGYGPAAGKSAEQGADCHDVVDTHWINGHPLPIANPMSVYREYQQYRKSWGINAIGSFIVEVESVDGVTGHGISIGGDPGCYIVENHLSRFVEGELATNVEKIWDQCFRASINYGRKGLTLQALSALDLALWDLLGKVRGEPVYNLLGGKTKDRLPVYCTSSKAHRAKELGFVGAKIPCAYGPQDGDAGFRKNVEEFRKARAAVGPDFPLMLDCYMALSVPYAIKLARALEPLGLKWIEEFLPPDDYDGYAEVKRALQNGGSGVLCTTGEHEYTRYGMRQLLEPKGGHGAAAVHVLQPDITWVGGLTEARRVVAMAAAKDVLVIPHGSSVYSYHLQYAFTNCPLAEYINLHPTSDGIVPYFGGLFEDEPLPKDGWIDLPDRPGFGVTLSADTRARMRRPHARTEAASERQFKRNAERKPPTVPHMPF